MTTATVQRPPVHPVGLEHKTLFGAGQKILSDEDGIVEAIVSVTGIEDEVKDIIVPGAYSKTLTKRLPKGVFSHDWNQPVGKALAVTELMPGDKGLPELTARGEPWPREAGAVLVKTQFNLDTQAGRDAYSNVKFYGEEQEWSIGYNVPKGGARVDHKKGLRYIQQLDFFEYSPVLFGAMPLAGTNAVKQYGGIVAGDTKVLPGSHDELREAVDRAINGSYHSGEDKADDSYSHIVGMFDDHVVYCTYEKGNRQEYDAPFTMTDGEATLGDPTPVKIMEMLVADTEPDSIDELPASEEDVETKRKFTSAERDRRASSGSALPDGSFPISNREDLSNAIRAVGRAKDKDKAKRHIIARARALDATSMLPDSWDVEKGLLWGEVKDPIGDALRGEDGFISGSERVTNAALRQWVD